MLTGYRFENTSVVRPRRDDWRPAQTHASLSAPSQCPNGKHRSVKFTDQTDRHISDVT